MRSSMTGVGYRNSEPRNFNRGYGRGNSKPFQQSQRQPSPQPPRRGGDVFMEAGRLAVEYLVSRGLLSSNVLPDKYQNGSLRNNSAEPNDVRSLQDRGNSRRSSVDRDPRSYSRENRRLGPSRSYTSDWTRENEKEGSVTEEEPPLRAMEVDSDAGHNDTTTKYTNTVVESSHPAVPASEDDGHNESQDEAGKGCPVDALDSKTASVVQTKEDVELVKSSDGHSELQDEVGKDCSVDALDSKMASVVQNKEDEELVKSSDGTEFEESKINADDLDKEKDTIIDGLVIQQVENKSSDYSSKSDPLLINEENNLSVTELDSLDTKNFNVMNDSEEIPSSKTLGSIVCDHSFTETGVVNPGYQVDQQKSVEPLSFTDKSFSYEEKSSGMPDLEMLCSSTGKDRGEKRPIEEDNTMEGTKKAKQQWFSVAQSDEFSQLSDLSDERSVSQSKSAVNIFNVSGSQESFTSLSLPLKGCVESNIDPSEKQLLSNSFKICDLNLMETSDMHENHGVSLLYPAISGPSRDLPADIDLSMRNNITNEYNTSCSVRKNIEIIDLESASLEGCEGSNTSLKDTEAGMTTLESFSNPQNSSENPDAQDGYGFMISELLGNEVPNCPSVQPDMNSLHNNVDMGLSHTEAMFSEDDPIYMSLGEIPLTGLLRAWEQPTQERNPFEL